MAHRLHEACSMNFRAQRLRLAVIAALLGACTAGATNNDDAETGQDDLIGHYRTPDPGNLWTRDVDLSRLAIGEETILADEDARFDQMARDIASMQARLERVNTKKDRVFHAKPHACVRGELKVSVPDSARDLKVGLFAQNGTYPTWVRFSNGTGFVQSDKRGDVRGVALKVMKVPGRKLMPGAEDALTQDFLMINAPTAVASDAARFVEFGKALTASRADENGDDVGTIEGMLSVGGFLLRSENKRIREYLVGRVLPRIPTHGSMLGEQFWTQVPIAMGLTEGEPMRARAKQAAKLTTIAGLFRNGRCEGVRDLPNILDKDYFRTDLVARMKQTETCLDVRVQLQRDPAKQPIEDASMEWYENEAPFVSVGYVVIPKTNLEDAAIKREEAVCNGLAFTPWHALPEHRPLGNMSRARLKAYDASQKGRGASTPEPTGDETL
jgi:hypothetical protein